jgi:NitT/TauT family transport system substrate-binding protein
VAPLRIGAHPWPGYELLYLARHHHHLDPRRARLIELPSASASLRALAAQVLEGACLTLDEVVTARERGLPLVIVAVLDVSHGADVVLGRRPVAALEQLRGQRIGVEPGAVGAVMLDAFLRRAGLQLRDIQRVDLTIDQHARAFRQHQVEALVTYEPVRSQLLQTGAVPLFSSADIPGRIVDTLALRADALDTPARVEAARHLVLAHFLALRRWREDPANASTVLAPRLQLPATEVPGAFALLDLPDIPANLRLMGAGEHGLPGQARELAQVMLQAGLLTQAPPLEGLVRHDLLPRELR